MMFKDINSLDFGVLNMKVAFFICFSMMLILPAQAQNAQPTDASQVYPNALEWTAVELWGGLGVIIFSLFITVAAIVLRKTAQFSEDGVIRLVSLILIVSGSLFLVTLGYSAEQIAPVLGLLGTIAGYMLGRASAQEDKVSSDHGDNKS